MDNVIGEIKNKIDIVDFIGSFITLKKTGRNFKANCPFHQEKTPSFIVSPERQIWHCFGACQEGGDVIKFLMKWENITFFEALKELAVKTGIKLRRVSFEDKIWEKKERLIGMNALAVDFFQFILNKTHYGRRALDYLNFRKINPVTTNKFQLGYAPQSWNSLLQFLNKKKYGYGEMLEAGLLVRSERGSYYDRFRGRLIFPIKDARGNTLGFSGRVLEDKSKEAKYINTPETPIYHKRETLFGINLAKETIKKSNNVILVEGELDVISPYQCGIENIVAIKGSAVTKEQLMLIKRYSSSITLALDSDEAGIEAVKRGINEAEDLDFEINAVSFDFAKDPDEAVRKDFREFKKIIARPMPIYDYLIDVAKKKYPNNDPFSKKKFGEDIIVFIEKIKNPIVKSFYIKKIAHLLQVSESSIETLVRQKKFMRTKQKIVAFSRNKISNLSRPLVIQKYLLSFILQSTDPRKTVMRIFKIITPDDFSIVAYQKIVKLFLHYIDEEKRDININHFIKNLPSELLAVFDEVYLFASGEFGLENDKIEKLSLELKRFSLKRKIGDILSNNDQSETKLNFQLQTLNQQLKEVEKTISKL